MSVTFASSGNLSWGGAGYCAAAGQNRLEYWVLAPPAWFSQWVSFKQGLWSAGVVGRVSACLCVSVRVCVFSGKQLQAHLLEASGEVFDVEISSPGGIKRPELQKYYKFLSVTEVLRRNVAYSQSYGFSYQEAVWTRKCQFVAYYMIKGKPNVNHFEWTNLSYLQSCSTNSNHDWKVEHFSVNHVFLYSFTYSWFCTHIL